MSSFSFCALSTDINECKTGRNTCANDTVCFNLDGGYDCRCPHGHNCTGDCIHDNKVKHSGQIWVLDSDRCSVCSCQVRNRWRWTWSTYGQREGLEVDGSLERDTWKKIDMMRTRKRAQCVKQLSNSDLSVLLHV